MPARPQPKKNILTLGPLEAEGKGAAETLAGFMADSKYFNQVVICDSALCSDDYSQTLSLDEVNQLSSMLGVDMLVSFERLFLELYFDFAYRISEKELIDEATRHASSVMCNKIVPYWQTVNRLYFDGGCVEMRDAGVYVNEGDWGAARDLWTQVYNRQKKGDTKFRAAYNIALSYEMTGDMEKTEEWLKKSSDYVKSGSEEEMVLKYYISQFSKRKGEFGKLNIQMGRFNNNF